MIHPLQTNDVTYIVQRAESLMGLFYFLTLYAFIQATTCPRPSLWYAASIFACFCGMATKEVMVTAPLMVFLYDRTFVAGSLKGAWAARRYYYIGLLSTWLLLAYLIAGAGTREGTVGTSIYTPWSSYVLMQPVALVQYLALSVWPSPLIFDYGSHVMHNSWILAGATSLIFLLASGIAYAIWRRPVLGFLGAWFLIILAPTSSILVVSPETISEHRMYLPLAAITAFLVLGLYALAPRLSWSLIVVSALVLGFLTYQRNWVYRDEYTVWMDTVTKVPDNLTAVTGLGNALIDRGQPAEAIPVLEQAIHASPSSPPAYTDLGIALFQLGRIPEAMTYFRDALNLKSTDAYTHFNYGLALDRTGHISEAIEQYREALQQKPTLEAARENLRRLLSKK
jgi:hypothetical protein